MNEGFLNLARRLGLHEEDHLALLQRALTHSSERPDPGANYEALERIGDQLIKALAVRRMVELCPAITPGAINSNLTWVIMVDNQVRAARALGIDKALSARLFNTYGEIAVLDDTFESVMAALWISLGEQAVMPIVANELMGKFGDFSSLPASSGKSPTQRLMAGMRRNGMFGRPRYVNQEYPENEPKRRWHSQAFHNEKLLGEGWAPSYVKAQKAAARDALSKLPKPEDNA